MTRLISYSRSNDKTRHSVSLKSPYYRFCLFIPGFTSLLTKIKNMESEGKELVAKAVTDSVVTATDDEENSVTLVDILEEEAQLEEDANAVLGGSDDANCTFQQVVLLLLL